MGVAYTTEESAVSFVFPGCFIFEVSDPDDARKNEKKRIRVFAKHENQHHRFG